MYSFSERLKELMIEENLSQNKLSKEVGIGQSQIARWLSNQQKPNVDNLITLAKYFKVSTDYLLGLID